MLVTRSHEFIAQSEVQKRSTPWKLRRELIWTDSFSNLLHLLR